MGVRVRPLPPPPSPLPAAPSNTPAPQRGPKGSQLPRRDQHSPPRHPLQARRQAPQPETGAQIRPPKGPRHGAGEARPRRRRRRGSAKVPAHARRDPPAPAARARGEAAAVQRGARQDLWGVVVGPLGGASHVGDRNAARRGGASQLPGSRSRGERRWRRSSQQ